MLGAVKESIKKMFMRFSIVNNATKFCRKPVQIVNGECVNKSAVLVPYPRVVHSWPVKDNTCSTLCSSFTYKGALLKDRHGGLGRD